jgi:hypothetical protein
MMMNRIRVATWVLSAIGLSASPAMAQAPSLIFNNLSGPLRIVQDVPCRGVIDLMTTITGGTLTLSPQYRRGQLTGGFHLTRLDMTFAPFSVQHSCNGMSASVDFRHIGVQLAVSFTGEKIGDGQYRFVIPKDEFLIFESIVDNQPVKQPQTVYRRPSEDVTGVIDLNAGTTQLQVSLSSRLHFRAGCVGERCAIDEYGTGRMTTDVAASIDAPRRKE